MLTDIADFPPHFWMERQEQYFICGSQHAVEQALAMGHPAERVFLASGMILQPRFYDLPPLDRDAERVKLDLDPALPTGLVLFGGYGSSSMLEIARRLEPLAGKLQLILIAGKNAKLENALKTLPGKLRRHVVGFTSEVPYYMQLADFFIGKPGPGSLSEAVHLGTALHHDAQLLDAATGALQLAMVDREWPRPGAAELQRNRTDCPATAVERERIE